MGVIDLDHMRSGTLQLQGLNIDNYMDENSKHSSIDNIIPNPI